MKKYSEFKKNFQGDPKLNITALDKDENVLAHRAVVFDSVLSSDAINKILQSLRNEVKNKEKIVKYEIVYPKV
jgi:predicted phosphoribosyltransferase